MALDQLLSFAHAILPWNAETKKDELSNDGGDEIAYGGFRMPLHYPRYVKSDYEAMEEWKVDVLLRQYGINFRGSLDEKRKFAMGAFLWPDQY